MQKIKLLVSVIIISTLSLSAQKKKSSDANEGDKWNSGTFSGLAFRSVGPALMSGRIADIAVNPNNHSEYYLAVASGGVWKTENAGTTFSPIFDGQGSYSIGCVTIDPNNTNIVWVGSGENNNQRSVAYGDGVYKSEDGGKSWKNMGLKESEHISKIIVHPHNSNIVYVAAYGPLWKEGGDRGVYQTTDGGETWNRILNVDEHTGFADLIMDPTNDDILYASAHQRRRHVFTYVGGGPGSGLHKSTDGGKTWKKINNGLPKTDLGRIGLAISPIDSDVLYAIVEASDNKDGFYKSTDRGASWVKQSDHSTSGNYYQELYCDLFDVNKVYSMDTWLHHTEDGGKTFKMTGEKSKHVDNHCMWQDPNDPDHWLVGCDGGLYETWDAAKNWQYKANLPITQFYKVAVDQAAPFYNIYGGTQDNNSMGGPSRTTNTAGIVNSDWYITNGGDGFESQIDPVDPNIVYAQAQYGWIVRYDKKSGESVGIQPMPGKGQPAYRWNWDAPLLISPHNHKRLYFCANQVFRSDDMGDSWNVISGDMTRQIDRNLIPVMGKIQSPDVVMKNKSTTIYGNIVALDESPKQENLLYIGTDDGLVHVTENAGDTWKKMSTFPGIPDKTYVNQLKASKHDANVVFAVFNNHKNGDFKPYILKSTDKGSSWTSISGNLPAKGTVYCMEQDHVNPDLLFAGTEFGVFFTKDGGKKWIQLKAGLPTIAIRDMEIQQRENDLVLASFGRGFYVLDDYSPLRSVTDEVLAKEAHIFPVKKSLMFIESSPLGGRKKSNQGESYYTAENPPVGANFYVYLTADYKTLKEKRQEAEKKAKEANQQIKYPTREELIAEARDEKPKLLLVINNDKGETVKKIELAASPGINKATWDFREVTTTAIYLNKKEPGRYESSDEGYLALPGKYTAMVYKIDGKEVTKLTDAVPFEIEMLNNATLPAADRASQKLFIDDLGEARRQLRALSSLKEENQNKLKYIEQAIIEYPTLSIELYGKVKELKDKLYNVGIELYGNSELGKQEVETYPSLFERVETSVWYLWGSRSAPTGSAKTNLAIAKDEMTGTKTKLEEVAKGVKELEKVLNDNKVPYTPNRTDFKEE